MHPHAELMSAGYAAFAAGDMETIDRILDDGVVWHNMGTSPLAGVYHGKAEVFDFFGRLLATTNGTFSQDVHAILADDDHAVVLTTNHWESPQPFSGEQVFVWHVRDGKGVECWGIPADQAATDAALTPPTS
jgi:ketosteroid isomerase-like protein